MKKIYIYIKLLQHDRVMKVRLSINKKIIKCLNIARAKNNKNDYCMKKYIINLFLYIFTYTV